MADYPEHVTLRDARRQYFDRNGFGDGGYDARWVTLVAGPVRFYLPNTAARVRSVKLHDLHHVVTAYDTTWTGEAEIAAWELASGCRRHYAAWLLNLGALAIGLAIAPRATFRAFLRGRQSANLYAGWFHEGLLAKTVGQMRRELGLDRGRAPHSRWDTIVFLAYAALAVAPYAIGAAVVVAALERPFHGDHVVPSVALHLERLPASPRGG